MLHYSDNEDIAGQTSEAAKRGKGKPYNENGSVRADKYWNLPALLLLENIRCEVMKRINTRFRVAQKWTSNLTPIVNSKIAGMLEEARFVDVMCPSEHEFEVKDKYKFFVVNLQTQSCDCGRWEVTRIIYKHMLVVITAKRLNVANYVDKSLTKAAYLKTYGYVIHPIPDQSHWPILVPTKKKATWAPKKKNEQEMNQQKKKEKYL
ncbi:hypothetical protein JRO89_XS06G0101600 [Xanthoceras sorbifolium]|uniref:Zinc finger PMZ-type domain-containing protein n=1 Tax=Xanthoceras sorbifolium TaxID=99658 RepID=A0ABQ8HXJ6_9ROSI|nr:hypothetical protein JRO89_XS06G0101600 [Xanthoceras sorbifolium]